MNKKLKSKNLVLILVKLEGGLGNQLFQYATARALCAKNAVPALYFDIRRYDNEYLGRQFGIKNFKIKGSILKSKMIFAAFTKNTKINKLFSLLGLYKNIEENKFVLHNLDKSTPVLTTLAGYWQSPVYFENIRPILLKELVPRQFPDFPQWTKESNTVAVGVRRTDYLTDTKYGFIGNEYYKDAFALIKERINNPLFVIFSDDIPWCKENFKNERVIFFEDSSWSKDYLKVFLLSKCKHQIISNSSFYWWGAWLNTNPDKIVIRPSRPFNDIHLLYEAHFPPEWSVINNEIN